MRHLFPVMFANEHIQRGDIKPADVPYEQRKGGLYDNTDVNNGYIPSGMSIHQWHELQRAEKKELQSKQFGKIGPSKFMSRSLQAFQEDLEKGKVRLRFTIFVKPCYTFAHALLFRSNIFFHQ